jgi:hypothetical protein
MEKLPKAFKLLEDDSRFSNFINDLIAEFILDRSRPYLEKYPEITSYE